MSTISNMRGSSGSLAAAINSSLSPEAADSRILLAQLTPTSTEVSLCFAQLSAIPELIRTANALTYLNLSHNVISVFPKFVFSRNASSNRIESLPDNLILLSSLSLLSLGDNKLSANAIESSKIGSLVSLTRLNLNKNLLEYFPHTLLSLAKLTHLGLSDNQISSIPSLNDLSELVLKRLRNNRLKTLPSLTSLTKLRGIAIADNAFTDERDECMAIKGRVSLLVISAPAKPDATQAERKRTVKSLAHLRLPGTPRSNQPSLDTSGNSGNARPISMRSDLTKSSDTSIPV